MVDYIFKDAARGLFSMTTMKCNIYVTGFPVPYILCIIHLVSGGDQKFLLVHASVGRGSQTPLLAKVVSTQVHWQSTMAGSPVTYAPTSVYARKATSNPQWLVNVLLTPVLWLP